MSDGGEGKKRAVLDCTGNVMEALLSLEVSAELMAHDTNVAPHVFLLGKAQGYIGAARALIEVAEKTMLRVIDHQGSPQSKAGPTPN